MKFWETEQLFDLSHTLAKELLASVRYPWQALPRIREEILHIGQTLSPAEYTQTGDGIWIAKEADIAATAVILAPTIIGKGTQVRPGAYIRGAALIGEGCVIGNSCELKNVILSDGVQVPHFNYVGDSVFGYRAHTGAGAVTSNVKSDKSLVCIHTPEGDIPTEQKKCGAFLGDFAEIGCNSVLNPGTVIGRNSNIYPLSSVRGTVPPNCIYKRADCIILKQIQP